MTADAENRLIAAALAHKQTACPAEYPISDPSGHEHGILVCNLTGGHGPVHYDPDGVIWAGAVAGMTREQAETVVRRLREAIAA